MIEQHFTDRTRGELTCKPCSMDEIRTVRWHGEDLAAIPVRSFSGGLRGLDHMIHEGDDKQVEFVALDEDSNDLYLVNTEGYTYTRYAGRLTADAANELIEAQAADA